ncbi:hypothetical protein AYO22_01562 [Fonsecaea multimorphosa]|nr:hypothetical protein AYO22_01562 [Fonsecaea multimorphosa]
MAVTTEENSKPNKLDARTQWAAFAIREQLATIQKQIPENVLPTKAGGIDAGVDFLYPTKETEFVTSAPNIDKFKVAIIGAGAAGLFTAMIFDYLKEQFDLDVDYEIIESRDRIGGRLFTHTFEDINKPNPARPSTLYYDVGAMRFPDIAIMKRTFELFRVLDMKKTTLKDANQRGDLIPYYLQGKNCPSLYNDVRAPNAYEVPEDFKPTGNSFCITGLPQDIAGADPGDLVADSIAIFTSYYEHEGPEKFWKKLKRQADPFTVRQWLTQAEGYDYNTIEFLETMNFGNRWYDQGLSEMILESLDFDAKHFLDPVHWRCVLGGAGVIPEKMAEKLAQKGKIALTKRVTAMSYKNYKSKVMFKDDNIGEIEVTTEGLGGETNQNTNTYHAVFNSAPLGAMQRMHLEGLNLSWGVKQGIRSLGYGSSCKVGVLFETQWWRDVEHTKLNICEGGVSKTDRPIRCCVYPSYNIDDPVDKPGVLLVSYTWSQEAIRMGSLIKNDDPKAGEELKQTIIHDLARLHAIKLNGQDPDADFKELKERISRDYKEHFAYDWSQDPHAAGAFAYFGPSQFQQLYPWITRSGGSNHIIIGEAASAHHAWVVGSLESAVRGVYQFLASHGQYNKNAAAAAQAYERTPQHEEKQTKDGPTIPWPFGPLPGEYEFTEDIHTPAPSKLKDEDVPAPIGQLARLQILMEQIRLRMGEDKIDPSKVKKEDLSDLVGVPNGVPA